MKSIFLLLALLLLLPSLSEAKADSSIVDTLLPLYPGASLRAKKMDGGYFVDRQRMALLQELFVVFDDETKKKGEMIQNYKAMDEGRSVMLQYCEQEKKMYQDLFKVKELDFDMQKQVLNGKLEKEKRKTKRAKRTSWIMAASGFLVGAAATTYFFYKIW